ncbi:MAG TPA: hypothetical protein VGN81_42275 [Pseudonocardiaceae bacterium]
MTAAEVVLAARGWPAALVGAGLAAGGLPDRPIGAASTVGGWPADPGGVGLAARGLPSHLVGAVRAVGSWPTDLVGAA